ncbi:copper resistance protein B [Lysobacter solisilvae]|uniref:Copper resistance protein B n=2 Tax=Agrilutibacter solisilvae TaxID=2763317 RepID=A0A974Y2C2_9GAMM|nr:copper resistance protein B [Lysobacter solisilvae]
MGHGTQETTPAEVDHAAMGHGTQETSPAEVDHAAMGHGTHEAAPAEVDHAAMGHGTHEAAPAEVDHAAMGHAMPAAPAAPITPVPPLTDADRAAARRPASSHPAHDDTVHSRVLFNRLEGFDADEGQGLEWEGQAWFGTDRHKLWLRSEGERVAGRTGSADIEVLYANAIATWWDLVAGIRHDFQPGPSQDFLAIGVVGRAPYKLEVEATGYVGTSGQVAARIELEYETLLTNRWILQPLVELNFHGQDDERRRVGAGLSSAEAGLRLRYEVTRRFAPYVGIVGDWSFGSTADFRREDGEATHDTRVVAGVRVWF